MAELHERVNECQQEYKKLDMIRSLWVFSIFNGSHKSNFIASSIQLDETNEVQCRGYTVSCILNFSKDEVRSSSPPFSHSQLALRTSKPI
jgi:hypothetical protein